MTPVFVSTNSPFSHFHLSETCHPRGLLQESLPCLGVLPLPPWGHAHKKSQPRPPGHRRVWGATEQTGAWGYSRHSKYRRAPPPRRIQKHPGNPRQVEHRKDTQCQSMFQTKILNFAELHFDLLLFLIGLTKIWWHRLGPEEIVTDSFLLYSDILWALIINWESNYLILHLYTWLFSLLIDPLMIFQ